MPRRMLVAVAGSAPRRPRRHGRSRKRRLALQRPGAAPGARHPLPGAGRRAAADERRRLAGAADPRLGRRAPTATASSSTRTSSTTTTAPRGSPTRGTRAPPAHVLAADGTYTYPTDRAYANNAADLVELRVKPLAAATAFRVTLNTLKDSAARAYDDRDRRLGRRRAPFPHGANVEAPAHLFLTVHGTSAELLDARQRRAGRARRRP